MFKYFLLFVLGCALILGSFCFLTGTMWGALPASVGTLLMVFGLGEILEPFNNKLFKE